MREVSHSFASSRFSVTLSVIILEHMRDLADCFLQLFPSLIE